jgi:hypothetical protein
MSPEVVTEAFARNLIEQPPVCEIADLVAAGAIHWRSQDDEPCVGPETWLLVGGEHGDAPSPLCGKHAEMALARIGPALAAAGLRLVRS